MIGVWFMLSVGLATFASLSVVNHSEVLKLDRRWLLGLAVLVALGLGNVGSANQIWSIVLVSLLMAIAVTDLKTQLLPDWLTGLLIGAGLMQSGFAFPAMAGAAICILCGLANATITRDEGMIGSADYLLCGALVAWLGPLHAIDAFAVALGVFGLQLIITRSKIAAFAPAIAIGLSVIWFGGPIL